VRAFLSRRYSIPTSHLHAVDYRKQAGWTKSRKPRPFAVVDFLYHPDAVFWADHHRTTFGAAAAPQNLGDDPERTRIYDQEAGSCAKLLWRELRSRFGFREPEYGDLVTWADRTDSARYASVRQALMPREPALLINLSLEFGRSGRYCEWLVDQLQRRDMRRVAASPEVMRRAARALEGTRTALEALRQQGELRDGVAVFNLAESSMRPNRYAPYWFHPDANYSAVLFRTSGGLKITAMRNPWKEFKGVTLGPLFARFGGGGHERVASLVMPKATSRAGGRLLDQIVGLIQSGEPRPRRGRKP